MKTFHIWRALFRALGSPGAWTLQVDMAFLIKKIFRNCKFVTKFCLWETLVWIRIQQQHGSGFEFRKIPGSGIGSVSVTLRVFVNNFLIRIRYKYDTIQNQQLILKFVFENKIQGAMFVRTGRTKWIWRGSSADPWTACPIQEINHVEFLKKISVG